ncbi:MAG: protease pro-enzyme activation domain-containing protein, partial [Acidimicrobiales bacterium]
MHRAGAGTVAVAALVLLVGAASPSWADAATTAGVTGATSAVTTGATTTGATATVPAAPLSGDQIAAAPRVPLLQGAATVPPGAQVTGTVPPATPVSVDVALGVPDPEGLSAFVAAVSTPAGAQYGHYLTPNQFATRFAPSQSAVDAVD